MLIPSQAWGALNAAKTRERRWYVVIEPNPASAADDFYIRSHSDMDLSSLPGTVIASKIIGITSSSQTLNPDQGRATIGSLTVAALDVSASLTDQQRTELLTNGRGLRGKKVSVYSGFKESLSIADYQLLETQVVDMVSYKLGGTWSLRCRDIQREARKEIFDPIVMNLAQPLDATSTTIEMVNIPAAFLPVEHGTSFVDAPGETVAYVRIDDEIIRIPAAGIGTTQFTSVTRGVLGTRAAEHTTDENSGSERGKKVTEVFYLEMPVPKMAYALLTGVLFGQSGTLPPGYHAGIDASAFVRTSEFQNIGLDLYDPSDDTAGTIEKYIIEESIDAKAFIERQLYRKYLLFSPVHANGELGLKRGQPVLSGSAVVGEINDSHITGTVTVKYDMTKIINDIEISWNEVNGESSRRLRIEDSTSIASWGRAPRLEVIAKGLIGSRHTESTVRDLYEGLRDRYSGPPLIASVPCQASQSLYEIGDVVRLRTDKIRDFTNAATNTLDRAVEVQGVRRDYIRGKVTYDVFGSTQKAGPLPPLETSAALADSFYTALGTNIATLPGVFDAGAELQLPDGLTLTGQSTNSVAGAIYYATKDVRIPSANTVTVTQNVQLRIRGVLQVDGEINGLGQGLAGVSDTVDVSGIPPFGNIIPNQPSPVDFATQAGIPGYYGSTQANGGLIERFRRRSGSSSRYRVAIQSLPATITQGQVEAIPSYNLQVPNGGGSVTGIPADLRGTSGGPGGVRYYNESRDAITDINRGGTGGNGGAGLLIVSRGAVFGGSGRINLSGADGAAGVRNAGDNHPAWSGGGAGGAPGAAIFILDGATVPSPTLTSGTIIADYGDSPPPGDPNNPLPGAWVGQNDTRINVPEVSGALVNQDRSSPDLSAASGREASIAAARIFFLLPYVEPEEDIDDQVILEAQVITLAVVEAYSQRDDPRVTVLQAQITEVSTTASYSHANIYVRKLGDFGWIYKTAAEPNGEFELPADGFTYEVLARPVLINGAELDVGVVQSALVTDSNLAPAAPSSIVTAPLVNGGTLKIQAPNTLGKPDVFRIYRSLTIDDASPTLIDTVPAFFVLALNAFCADYTDSQLTGGTNYYYWAEAQNETGTSALYPAVNGVLLTPDDNTGGTPGTPGADAVAGGVVRAEWIKTTSGFTPSANTQDVGYTFSRGATANISSGTIRGTRDSNGNITSIAQQGAQVGEAHTLGTPTGLGTRSASVVVTHDASGRTYQIFFVTVVDGSDGLNAARTMALGLNAQRNGTANAGEASIYGVNAAGTADLTSTVAPSFLWNGSVITLPHLNATYTLNTGLANRRGFICVNTALPGDSFNVATIDTDIALVYKVGSQWYYDDNNTTPSTFTPDAGYVAIGWLETGAADNLIGGGLFGEAVTLTLAAEPKATDGANVATNLYDSNGNLITDSVITNFDDATALKFNSSFSDWTSTFPTGWAAYGVGASNVSKETTIKLTGPHSVKFTTTGASDSGMQRRSDTTSPAVDMRFSINSVLVGSYDVYVESRVSGTPGLIVDLIDGAGAYYRKYVPVPDPTDVGRWQRVEFKVSANDKTQTIGGTPSGSFVAVRIYAMASFSSAFGISLFQGSVEFDNMRFAILSPNIENEAQVWANISGTANAPEDNATNNTGALADADSVSQFQIDLHAAHRVAAEATAAGISLAGTGYVTIEDVTLTLPESVTDSVVQVDCSFSILGIGAGGEAGLTQFYQTMAVRLLDEDNAVVQTDVLYLPYFRNTSGSSSVRIAADAFTYTFYVPAANLNASAANTFKLQIDRDVTSNWSSLTAFQRNIRATLLNQAES